MRYNPPRKAELALLGRVSRARITQVMDLLMLAPEIQEELVFDSRRVTIALTYSVRARESVSFGSISAIDSR